MTKLSGFFLAAAIVFNTINAEAGKPVPQGLWKGLIAEAVSEGYDGMFAVACCVRNRLRKGMNHGLCAMKRKNLDVFVAKQGVKYEEMAKEIVRKVFDENVPDITGGSTHYENVEKFGVPYWAKKMTKMIKIGCHTFYREG